MSEVLFHSNYDSRLEIIRFFFSHENREWSEYETFHFLKCKQRWQMINKF